MITKNNHSLKVLLIIASMLGAGRILDFYGSNSILLGYYFEVVTGLLPLVLSLSIFATSWFAYGKNKDNNSLFLGATFFFIGIFDMFHMLSYPYMPDFITHNSLQKASAFWLEARFISALMFLASVYIYKETLPDIINKPVLFSLVLLSIILSLGAMVRYPGFLFGFNNSDGTPNNSGSYLLILTVLVISYSSYLYYRKLKKTGQKSIICLLYGFIIIAAGVIVYPVYDFSGQLLKASGAYFIYFALFKSSIEQPYEKMADAEHKLRFVAEEKYRNLFDNANDAIIITDLEDNITSWNRGAENIFLWKENEVIGMKLSQAIIPARLETERKQIIRNVLDGKAVTGFDALRIRKDGKEIDVSMTLSPLRNSDQEIIGLSSIIRDITERKLAEEAMHESEARYRKLVELSPDAIAVSCIDVIVFINAAGAKLFGAKDPEQLIGKDIMDFVHPDHKIAVRKRIRQIMETGKEAPTTEDKFIQFDGTVIDVEDVAMPFIYQGKPAVQIVINDVTQRKLAVEALKQSEEHFRSLIENSSDVITILNDAKTICYVSHSIERSLGYSPKELTGSNIVEILHPDDISLFVDSFLKRIQAPDTTSSVEVRMMHQDGSFRILESMGKKLPVGLVVTGIVLNSRDVTERKRAEEQIRASLAEKEVLLREIHHRVKNNMQIISSLLNLQSDVSKDKNVIDMFKDSRNRILSMSLIHEKLYQSENFTKIDLRGYIKDLANGLFQSFNVDMSRIKLNIEVENVLLGIDSAIPCGLIINELITNSLKYAFPGDKKGEIKILLHSTEGGMIELMIEDNGVGIPEEFDLRTVRSLGLHLVNILAENQLQGNIELTRTNGAKFKITFRG
ncbi:MAG: PAS domain S-box protein [Candidatus Methanoperedens sp.]|nr:PAS domain S-box protein [Candidatus Methanoperedens sp.]